MTRKQRLDKLTDVGYQAAKEGAPCEAPVTRELERAAWEIGWRARKAEKQVWPYDVVGIAAGRKLHRKCGWFLLCENPATTTVPHPILGTVPVCERCKERSKR